MKILIAGDLVPTKSNYELFSQANIQSILGNDLWELWKDADIRIVNLEAPIIDEAEPIKKSGPSLKIPSSCIKGIKELDPTIVNLANNHVLDYGEDGLFGTMNLLNQNNIPYIGAGKTQEEAMECKVLTCGDVKIGICSYAETEFSAVSKKQGGANVVNYKSLRKLETLCKRVDYVIVLYHGGKEHYPYPTPYQQEICRTFVDIGANLVVCQHSHCVGCGEDYKDAQIVYGQGNFIFDYIQHMCWDTGIIIEIDYENNKEIKFVPICRSGNVIRMAKIQERREIIDAYESRSQEIITELEKRYHDYIQEVAIDYLYYYAGWNRIIRGIDKILFQKKLIKKYFGRKKCLKLLGLIQCETHKEIVETYLKQVCILNE